MKDEFNNFFDLVKDIKSNISISGRYPWQITCEKNTLKYIIKILKLKNSDCLLDIGCNTGNFTIPLSFFVDKVYGIDNLRFIKKFNQRYKSENIFLLGKNFLHYNNDFNKKFDKILIFSVVQYLKTLDEVILFLNKAINLLNSKGILYIGDLPNYTKKIKFENTKKFYEIKKNWDINKKNKDYQKDIKSLKTDITTIKFDNKKINKLIKILKSKNLEISLLNQPTNLCMSYTRSDIIIKKI